MARAALITGGSRGIGRAIALRLARDGCDVAIVYAQDDGQAAETVDAIRRLGRRALPIRADVADGQAVAATVQRTVQEFGALDILVCNAAIFSRSLIEETTDEEFQRTFDVNVRGVFNCLRAALPVMMARRAGRVITISSHIAKRGAGVVSKATYAATKAAVEAYTKGAALEAAPYGITVNCVSPGWIHKGPLPEQWSAVQRKLLGDTPLGRPGSPDDVASAVAYLASAEVGYVTGEVVDVNGGSWMD